MHRCPHPPATVVTRSARTAWTVTLLLASGCAIQPEPGWQEDLGRKISTLQESETHSELPPSALAPNDAAADLGAGDAVELGVTLHDGAHTKTWRLEVAVDAVVEVDVLDFRSPTPFEQRVQPGAARREQLAAAQAEWLRRFRDGSQDLEDLITPTPVARMRVAAFAADGAELGVATSGAIAKYLRDGLLSACRAGHRQREPMRGRVAAGVGAPMLEVDDAAYDDVQTVAQGVATCARIFRVLQENKVLRGILREVLALPSLWSILTNWGVRVSFAVDFFAAERVDPALFPGAPRELWSVPLVLELNGQPGFLALLVVGPAGSPDGAVAGLHGIVARHPTDPGRSVIVRVLGSRRGRGDDGKAEGT